MLRYVQGIADDYLEDAAFVPHAVSGMHRSRRNGGLWEIKTDAGDTYEADSVILATGALRPRQIDGLRIKSNLDTVAGHVSPERLIVERFQRELADEELETGRPIVLIGLGNSTAAMLNQIYRYEDRKQTSVNYMVLTDLSPRAVHHPSQPINGRKPIYRNPALGYLTGYSGDLPHDRAAYERALGDGAIYAGITEIQYSEQDSVLRVYDKVGPYGPYGYIRDPHVFALLGYEKDKKLFRAMGALSRGWLRAALADPQIRPCDGAVYSRRDGYMSNVFAAGAAAATPQNPNPAVIPGMYGQVPSTTATISVRNYVR